MVKTLVRIITGSGESFGMVEKRVLNAALLGGGMFGSDVVLRSIEDIERCGIAPYLGRIGLDHRAQAISSASLELVAIGTRTAKTAEALCGEYSRKLPGASPEAFHGETPWIDIFEKHKIDILYVATPDSLHYAPVLHALENGAHSMVEKPLTLHLEEADELIKLAQEKGLVVGVDMHKRYDPCHRFIFEELAGKIGKPLYARAVLEEPLEVSTETFKWAQDSNPFSYVGIHWLDLFAHYLGADPVSVHAVGQKQLLANWDSEGGDRKIDTFDAMQVSVDYQDGLRVYYVNSWINPGEFEGAVNQEMELTGTRGKVEFDQQDRGLRATISGLGSKTYNPHFTADIPRPGLEHAAYDGYGKDSIVAITHAAMEVSLGLSTAAELENTYPTAKSSRSSIAVIEAAAEVAQRNLELLDSGRGSPVTARISASGYELNEPPA